jgi:predicted pyridoxine 5'-phosphate oxidase superfamily flavin-nucleotide-binding protein
MVAMPDDVKNTFENPECDKEKALTWVSTVTEDGDPHLAPVCFVKSIDIGLTRLNLDKSASAYRKLVKMEYTMQKTSTDIENGVSNA